MSSKRYRDPRFNRLAHEHELLRELCQRSQIISFQPIEQQEGFPPEKYQLNYQLNSIVGINNDQSPVYDNKHIAEITLPNDYPMTSPPRCYMKTTIWHPNIRHSGEFAGRICINSKALGHWHTIDMLAERIGEMLQYKNYHVLNIRPHPEDPVVARWVINYAEPNNIVNKEKNIFTDDRPLLLPDEEWLNSRENKLEIKILGKRSL